MCPPGINLPRWEPLLRLSRRLRRHALAETDEKRRGSSNCLHNFMAGSGENNTEFREKRASQNTSLARCGSGIVPTQHCIVRDRSIKHFAAAFVCENSGLLLRLETGRDSGLILNLRKFRLFFQKKFAQQQQRFPPNVRTNCTESLHHRTILNHESWI